MSGPHFRSIYTINEGEGPGLKVMLSAPKRIWPKAKDRNRQKRRLKEAFRLEANPLKAAVSTEGKTVHLALLASSKKPADFAELRLKMKLTLEAIANELSF